MLRLRFERTRLVLESTMSLGPFAVSSDRRESVRFDGRAYFGMGIPGEVVPPPFRCSGIAVVMKACWLPAGSSPKLGTP